MAAPALDQRRVGGAIDASQHGGGVEFDEGAGAQLGPGVGERASAQVGEAGTLGQLGQELMQMGLERLETFLEQQEHNHGKGQDLLPGEVRGPEPMAGTEARLDEPLAQLADEVQSALVERKVVLHPKGTYTM